MDKKIAIVYDWIDKWGGVERILLTLHEMFPHSTFYTSYFDINSAQWASRLSLKPSFIQRFPQFIKKSRFFSLPLYPLAFESFNFDSYNFVISVTSSFAKAVITKPSTRHVCYLLTPTRFLWSHVKDYQNNMQKKTSSLFSSYLKTWDLAASQRPDKIISISETVAKRCSKYYGRESEVIYPPFDVEYWSKINLQMTSNKLQTNSKFYLVVSRLEPYKKVDLAIKVLNNLPNEKFIIVGQGTQERNLKSMANKNIELIPYVSDEELAYLYSQAEALIMPQEEDFGYVSLEAQFFGCPVIAYKKGGATETIINNRTGLFFSEQTISSVSQALEQFHTISYNLKNSTKEFGRTHVEKFSKEKFTDAFKTFL
ncbi:glycosyltransferase [Candidatus Roizmanbacteria bacterium]|nr:glycosyltransferase [Candidatus Roizmanbacteria bacterium]